MPIFTGTITDVGGGHLVGKNVEVLFTLNSNNTNGSVIFPTEPAKATPDNTGLFSVNLAVTTKMRDAAWYTMQIRWLDSGNNAHLIDFPDWRIETPVDGGILTDGFIGNATNQRMVYVSLTPPPNPRPFALWLKQNPDNPASPSSTGDLYEWSNIL